MKIFHTYTFGLSSSRESPAYLNDSNADDKIAH